MKLSIINYRDNGASEVYTLKSRRGYLYDIIINHEEHETLIFDYQTERFISEIYGVYLNIALNELHQFTRLWQD